MLRACVGAQARAPLRACVGALPHSSRGADSGPRAATRHGGSSASRETTETRRAPEADQTRPDRTRADAAAGSKTRSMRIVETGQREKPSAESTHETHKHVCACNEACCCCAVRYLGGAAAEAAGGVHVVSGLLRRGELGLPRKILLVWVPVAINTNRVRHARQTLGVQGVNMCVCV